MLTRPSVHQSAHSTVSTSHNPFFVRLPIQHRFGGLFLVLCCPLPVWRPQAVLQNATAALFLVLGVSLSLCFGLLSVPYGAAVAMFIVGPRFSTPVKDTLKVKSNTEYALEDYLLYVLDRFTPMTEFFNGASVETGVFYVGTVAPILQGIYQCVYGVFCVNNTCYKLPVNYK